MLIIMMTTTDLDYQMPAQDFVDVQQETMHVPRHMRRGAAARIGNRVFDTLQEALDEGQNRIITLLRNVVLVDHIEVCTANTTLDLAGYTIALVSAQTEDHPSSLTAIDVYAHGLVMRNGSIVCSSGAPYAVAIKKNDQYIHAAPPNVQFERMSIHMKSSYGFALYVNEGNVQLDRSRVASSCGGILLQGEASHAKMSVATLSAQRGGILMYDGRLHLEDATVTSKQSGALYAFGGVALITHSTVRAYKERAIVVRTSLGITDTTCVDIHTGSDVCSFANTAIDVGGGVVRTRGATIRSTSSTAILLGTQGLEDQTGLDLSYGTTVQSWRGSGVEHFCGTLHVIGAKFECDMGATVIEHTPPSLDATIAF